MIWNGCVLWATAIMLLNDVEGHYTKPVQRKAGEDYTFTCKQLPGFNLQIIHEWESAYTNRFPWLINSMRYLRDRIKINPDFPAELKVRRIFGHRVENGLNVWSITVKNITFRDVAAYVCQNIKQNGGIVQVTTVTRLTLVGEKPQWTARPPDNTQAPADTRYTEPVYRRVGDSFTFTCKQRSSDTFQMIYLWNSQYIQTNPWLFDSDWFELEGITVNPALPSELQQGIKFHHYKENQLNLWKITISEITPRDFAVYGCYNYDLLGRNKVTEATELRLLSRLPSDSDQPRGGGGPPADSNFTRPVIRNIGEKFTFTCNQLSFDSGQIVFLWGSSYTRNNPWLFNSFIYVLNGITINPTLPSEFESRLTFEHSRKDKLDQWKITVHDIRHGDFGFYGCQNVKKVGNGISKLTTVTQLKQPTNSYGLI